MAAGIRAAFNRSTTSGFRRLASIGRLLMLIAGVLWMAGALPSLGRAEDGKGQTIHRCVGRNGEIAFSGVACGDEGNAFSSMVPADTPAKPPAPKTCARTLGELRDLIALAIARHDPNALAGLLRWQGVSGGIADQRLRALSHLVKGSLITIDDDAIDTSGTRRSTLEGAASGDDRPGTASTTAFRVRTGGDEGESIADHEFGVTNDRGCYWLDW